MEWCCKDAAWPMLKHVSSQSWNNGILSLHAGLSMHAGIIAPRTYTIQQICGDAAHT